MWKFEKFDPQSNRTETYSKTEKKLNIDVLCELIFIWFINNLFEMLNIE